MALPKRQPEEQAKTPAAHVAVRGFQRKVMRPFGFALVLLGGVLGKYFIYDVLEVAKTESPDLTFSTKLTILIGIVPAVGLLMVILGPKAVDLLKIEKGKMSLKHFLVIGMLLIPALGLLYWFRTELVKLGYQFQ